MIRTATTSRFIVRNVRHFSWDGHGTDLLSDSLAHNFGAPKIILHAHGNSGFDVGNVVKNMDPSDPELLKTKGIVHMAGSILAFPTACYMWNVRDPQEITMEKLAPLRLLRPKLEYLFIGSSSPIPMSIIEALKQELTDEQSSIVIEPMNLRNAMGSFNVLNGEDRMVAAALILPPR